MTQNPSTTAAINSLEAARAANLALRAEYETPARDRDHGHPARVAGLHQLINYGLKAAEVEALVAIAEAAGTIAKAITPREAILAGVPETTELRRRLALEGERAAFTPEVLG